MTDGTDTGGTDTSGTVREELQSERGAPGSRDTGSDEPGGGPVNRPGGSSDATSDTTVDPQGAQQPGAPDMPSGDQSG